MEISLIIPHIEALIFASDKPLISVEITELINTALGFIEDRASLDQVETAIEGIKEKYDSEFYAFELKQSGGGWQFLTKPAYHKTVALINGDKFIKRLSTASLETLAIIAYKQPITKSEIESIRGVNCDYAVQKLLEKDLVIISGRNEDAVGKPLIYGTSKSFMDYFGINSADELPKISEVMMEEYIKATSVKSLSASEDENDTSIEVVNELSGSNNFDEADILISEAEIVAVNDLASQEEILDDESTDGINENDLPTMEVEEIIAEEQASTDKAIEEKPRPDAASLPNQP